MDVVKIMYEISCIEIPKFYKEVEGIESENENFVEFLKNKEEILKEIIRQLTYSEESKSKKDENLSCSADYFLTKFELNRLVKLLFNIFIFI